MKSCQEGFPYNKKIQNVCTIYCMEAMRWTPHFNSISKLFMKIDVWLAHLVTILMTFVPFEQTQKLSWKQNHTVTRFYCK